MFFLRRRASTTTAAVPLPAEQDAFEVEMPTERRRSVRLSVDGDELIVEETIEESSPSGVTTRTRRRSSINLDELQHAATNLVDDVIHQVLREASAGEHALHALDGIMDDLDAEHDEMATSLQRQTLVEFILQRDNKFEYANEFVQMFKLYDCCKAVQEKYGALPPGWDLQKIPLPKGGETATVTQTDHRINEILDSEHRFVSTIMELQHAYLDRLYEVFGSGNKDDIQKLGLTQDETNQIFEQLPAICRFSQQLLKKLEPISMVRTQPVTGEGRAVHVGLAFRDMAHKLHVYAPAITSYQQTLQILTTKTQKLADQQGKKRHQHQGNFVQLWEQVTKDNSVLRGQQLNAVLITPMQRIPRYKMLLEQLVKDCEDVAVIQEALELFTSAARNINEAVRSHEKLVGFFGAGSELKPMSSTGGATKGGEVKIVNSYTHKLVS